MMSKHTSGPWEVTEHDCHAQSEGHPEHGMMDSLVCTGAPNFREIADVRRIYNGNRDIEMERANARLIAAAPELLEVAEAFIGIMNSWGWSGDYEKQSVEKARAAIAKARGEGAGHA